MKHVDNIEFGVKIAMLRKEKDMSQAKLAELTGITQQTLSRYENGERQASLDFIVNIADIFEVSADYLLGLSDVKAIDQDMKIACEVTGLSDVAMEKLCVFLNHIKEEIAQSEESYKNGLSFRDVLRDMRACVLTEQEILNFYHSCSEKVISWLFENDTYYTVLKNIVYLPLTIVDECACHLGDNVNLMDLDNLENESSNVRLAMLDVYDCTKSLACDIQEKIMRTFEETIRNAVEE